MTTTGHSDRLRALADEFTAKADRNDPGGEWTSDFTHVAYREAANKIRALADEIDADDQTLTKHFSDAIDNVYVEMEKDALGGNDKGTMGVFRFLLHARLKALRATTPTEPKATR